MAPKINFILSKFGYINCKYIFIYYTVAGRIIAEMLRNLFIVLSGIALHAITVTKGDTRLLQNTVENLVNYTALEALEQLDLDEIGNAIVDIAYKNYSSQGRVLTHIACLLAI